MWNMILVVNDFPMDAPAAAEDAGCVIAGEHSIPRAVASRTAFMLVRLGGVIGEIADEQLAAAGVDARGYSILAILSAEEIDSQLQLAQMIGKAPGVIVAEIDQLEEHGLIRRTAAARRCR
jgi:DNA-binding MarR family transcriptional regulator